MQCNIEIGLSAATGVKTYESGQDPWRAFQEINTSRLQAVKRMPFFRINTLCYVSEF